MSVGRALWGAIGLAILLRVALVLLFSTHQIPADNDHFAFGYELGRMGRSLVAGQGFVSPYGGGEPSAWMPPVYPALIAITFWVFGVYSDGSALALLLFQSLCGALAVPLGYRLARLWGGVRAGLVAAYGLALYPAAIYLAAGMIWSSTLAVLLTLGILIVTGLASERSRPELGLLGGLLVGLVALVDPVCVVLFAGLALALLRAPGSRASRLRGLALSVAGASVVILPWAVRNRIALGEWVVLKSNFGNELWIGNNPRATGGFFDAEGRMMHEQLSAAERAELAGLSEPRASAWLGARARAWMAEHPRQAVALTLERIRLFWWQVDFARVSTKAERVGGQKASTLLEIAYRAALVLGLLGLALAFRRGQPVWPALLFLLLYPLTYYITHVSNYRYRFPIEPLLVCSAGLLVARRPRPEPVS